MFRTFNAGLWPLALMAALTPGCGSSSSSVTGEVTFNGQPVNGWITFLPVDGKGPPAACEIEKGQYTVANITPGPKLVKVEAVKAVTFARTSEEMAKRAAVNKVLGDGSGLIDPADIIPPNAEGNNVKVEIKPGKQTHDFHLKKPAGTRGR